MSRKNKFKLFFSKISIMLITLIIGTNFTGVKEAKASDNKLGVELKSITGNTKLTSKKSVKRPDGLGNINYTTYTDYKNQFEYLTINGKPVFCVEPWMQAKKGYNYTQEYLENLFENNKELKRDIELITYYGWNTSKKTMEDYTTTQLLIWEVMSNYGVYKLTWESKPGFYDSNKNMIIKKVNKSKKTPSFNGQVINTKLGKVTKLIDENNVLFTYMEASGYSPNTDINKDGYILRYGVEGGKEFLTIKPTENAVNGLKLSFENIIKKHQGTNIVYINETSQKVSPITKVSDFNSFNLVLNVKKEASLKLLKVDENNNPVKGVVFEASYNKDFSGSVFELVTENDGSVSKTLNEVGRIIYVREKSVPNYLVKSNEIKSIELKSNKVNEIKFVNKFIKGKVKIVKTDSKNGSRLYGAKFEIKQKENGVLVDSLETNKQGIAESKLLPYGEYIVKEVKAPENYKLNSREFIIKINENNQIVTMNITNEKEKGILEFSKTDISSGKLVAGATIEFYKKGMNKPFLIGITDENGKINKNGATGEVARITENGGISLEEGEYFFKETKAPKGYILNDANHEFAIKAGEVTKDNLTNEKKIEKPSYKNNTPNKKNKSTSTKELPKTGNESGLYFMMLGFIGVILGMILFRKKVINK